MAQRKTPVQEGRKAPRFRLSDQDGTKVTAKELDGAPYVIFFYPKANTSG